MLILFVFYFMTIPDLENDSMRKLEDMLEQIIQLTHVAKEIRIVPMENAALGPLLLGLQQAKLGVEVSDKADGMIMLRIWAQECQL